MTSLYEQFRQSADRDGPDYSVVENAKGKDRDELEADLIKNLEYFEALALGVMRSKSALHQLKQMLATGNRDQQTACGRALWDIESDPQYLKPIVAVIRDRNATSEFERIYAIGLLTRVCHIDAFDALEYALFDPEYLVRCNAATVFSINVAGEVDDRTVYRNVDQFDREKLERYAQRLRAKIQQDSLPHRE